MITTCPGYLSRINMLRIPTWRIFVPPSRQYLNPEFVLYFSEPKKEPPRTFLLTYFNSIYFFLWGVRPKQPELLQNLRLSWHKLHSQGHPCVFSRLSPGLSTEQLCDCTKNHENIKILKTSVRFSGKGGQNFCFA